MFQVFCDFDGTVTDRDSIVFLTEEFGGGAEFRRDIFDQLASGRITVFEAIQRELATVKISWDEARAALLANISVDPSFEAFVNWCRRHGFPVSVVSSGLEPVVSLFLADMDIPLFAHPVEILDTGWVYRKRDDHDKTVLLRAAAGQGRIVYAGDGASDLKALPYADFLFATRYLADYCQAREIPFFRFESFADIQRGLEGVAAAVRGG